MNHHARDGRDDEGEGLPGAGLRQRDHVVLAVVVPDDGHGVPLDGGGPLEPRSLELLHQGLVQQALLARVLPRGDRGRQVLGLTLDGHLIQSPDVAVVLSPLVRAQVEEVHLLLRVVLPAARVLASFLLLLLHHLGLLEDDLHRQLALLEDVLDGIPVLLLALLVPDRDHTPADGDAGLRGGLVLGDLLDDVARRMLSLLRGHAIRPFRQGDCDQREGLVLPGRGPRALGGGLAPPARTPPRRVAAEAPRLVRLLRLLGLGLALAGAPCLGLALARAALPLLLLLATTSAAVFLLVLVLALLLVLAPALAAASPPAPAAILLLLLLAHDAPSATITRRDP
mmetsp:Transcript_31426/g.93341  ORF Transcript_31426/g.93341 Transcript_31426/m.93341 type:complete len:340 (-) Transcript_31426:31-1050(-)